MKTGQSIYLQLPSDPCVSPGNPDRFLHRAMVMGVRPDGLTIAVEESDLDVAVDMDVTVLFNDNRVFVQQPARIIRFDDPSGSQLFDTETTGDTSVAEQREFYRVSAVGSTAIAQVGDDLDSRMQDVSATGFAVSTTEEYHVGEMLPVVLTFHGWSYSGQARVQNTRKLWGHRIRYGLLCVHDKEAGHDLRDGLVALTSELQSIQLKRLREVR